MGWSVRKSPVGSMSPSIRYQVIVLTFTAQSGSNLASHMTNMHCHVCQALPSLLITPSSSPALWSCQAPPHAAFPERKLLLPSRLTSGSLQHCISKSSHTVDDSYVHRKWLNWFHFKEGMQLPWIQTVMLVSQNVYVYCPTNHIVWTLLADTRLWSTLYLHCILGITASLVVLVKGLLSGYV